MPDGRIPASCVAVKGEHDRFRKLSDAGELTGRQLSPGLRDWAELPGAPRANCRDSYGHRAERSFDDDHLAAG